MYVEKYICTCDVIGSKGSAHLNSLCKWRKNTVFVIEKENFHQEQPKEKNNFI